MSCTDFCTRLKALSVAINTAPSREELLTYLPAAADTREWYLGIWDELQRRNSCEVCRLAVSAIAESIQQAVDERVDPDQPVNIVLFPEEASFRLSFPSPLHARLAFIALDVSEAQNPDTARLLRQEGIDLARVREWLDTCDKSHESCSWRNNLTEPATAVSGGHDKKSMPGFKKHFNEEATSNFRVIDLESSSVKHVPLDVEYVALSYVWGQLPMMQLRKDNFEMLSSEGGLDKIRQLLPRTIIDAMDLLRALNIRYLWIDGLCLIQDDREDVSLGVSMMNSIYHGSYFTIVAASGHDANAGLPGVRQGTACPERQQNVARIASEVQMTVIHSIDWHLKHSIYNQRGWTLQELVLPDRTLIFVNGQAYFRCHEANWSEETWADKWTHWLDTDDSNISRVPDPVEGFLPSCWAYQKLCEDFSRRKLRNDEDALRALEGVTRPMAAGMETDLIEGLPGYYLDHFLLLISTDGNMRRRPQFASFSWAGWDGAKMWPRENFEWPEPTGDGTSTSKRRTENILRYLQYNRLIERSSVGFNSHAEQLTECSYDTPSPILQLMRKHPAVFSNLDEDPVAEFRRSTLSRFGGSSSCGDIPRWGSRSYTWAGETHVDPGAGVHKTKSLPEFCMKALDLAHGQAEFDRLIDRMSDVHTRLAMANWTAVRRLRAQRKAPKTARMVAGKQNTQQDTDTNPLPAQHDRRVEAYERWLTLTKNQDADISIPAFPPYPILAFATISLHLALGPLQPSPPLVHPNSPFHRVPGIPLLGASGATVGSLHPDNFSLLPPPGSLVEVLIVARCWKRTVGSALSASCEDGGAGGIGVENAEKGGETGEETSVGAGESEGEEKGKRKGEEETGRTAGLFWILHVVWESGIAQRRGVGQLLESALENAVGAVGVKSVLLG